ncbi:MAG TPA: metallophosphoesterase [Polyangiaceae bacterium]|nr:metallophosphoesterase [Polyangiaceae bacterium]
MKIAHFSDLHLLALDGVQWARFLNKRLTGWANLRLKRGAVHRSSTVRAIARDVAAHEFDHVVITGDLTNLALESEFELVREVLERDLGLDPSSVSLVPGNHDLYTRGALNSRRFERYFGRWLSSDLPEIGVDVSGARFPVVRLRGCAAIVSLSSAVPRPPFIAAGELGVAQLDALDRVLAHPEVSRRTVIVALHHPAVVSWSRMKHHAEGLRDSAALLSVLRRVSRGLVLHGHLHRRTQRTITTSSGTLLHVGATSASLHHDSADRMAGYNVYEMDEDGVTRVHARVFDPRTGTFALGAVPIHS